MQIDLPAFVTKVLLPQRRADVLRRSRLLDFLHQHIDRRLLLVCAPAGSGKTTLLVDFAHEVDIPVCWYTLGPSDADVRVFFEYLISAIRQRFPAFGRQTEAALQNTVDLAKGLSAVVGVLVSEMHAAIPEYFILVLDDLHAIDDSDQVNAAIDLILHYLPENCHIVVTSRTIPKFTLSRLAAHRQVAGLGNSDLRFTTDEIKRLLSENYKVLLPQKTAETLAAETEGWITGILLTTHTMWQGLVGNLIKAKGARGEVFEYLASEVFGQQPPDVQRFLLATAVLEQLHPELCGALLDIDDAKAKLTYVEEANLFLTRLEGSQDWYRYHQLFRAFLENKLQQEHAEWHVALQRKAASLSAARAAWDEAILHYQKGADYDQAVSIIVSRAGEMIDGGKLATLARWIDALPPDLVANRPELLLVRGRIHLRAGEPERGLKLLGQAFRQFAERGDELNAAKVLTSRSIGLAMQAHYSEAVADCEAALSMLKEHHDDALADVYRSLGICRGMEGCFAESAAALEEALRLQRRDGGQYAIGTLHQSLGVTYGRIGDVPRARHHFEEALSTWRRLDNAADCGQTLNSMGILLFDDGDYEAALSTLAEALAKVREGNYLRLEAAVLAAVGDVRRSLQQYVEACEQYDRSIEIARRVDDGYLVGYALNGLGDTYARMGEFRRADRFIRQAIVQAEERQSAYERGMYEATLGMLRCDQGEGAKGLRHLTKACELLRQAGSKRELTRALAGHARALHQTGREREALVQLQAALNLGTEIDYEQFLVLDGKRLEVVLLYARERGIADERLASAQQAVGMLAMPVVVAETPALQAIVNPRPAPLCAFAFGQTSVSRDGKEIGRAAWAGDKVREIFFFLLDHKHYLTKEQIAGSIWPDLPTASCNSSFHSTMYRLRRALQGDYVVQHDGRYRLSADVEFAYDVAEFEQLLNEADRHGEAVDVASFRRAISLYRGPFLKDIDAEWCTARRRQLEVRYFSALNRLATAAAARSEHRECLELCQRIIDADPYSEEGHYFTLRSHVALSDPVTALRHYRQYAILLRDELGVTPSSRIRAIYDSIVRGEVPSAQR